MTRAYPAPPSLPMGIAAEQGQQGRREHGLLYQAGSMGRARGEQGTRHAGGGSRQATAGRSTPGRGDRAGAAAGLLAHHRGRWWTATRAQARAAPGTLSQCPLISVYLRPAPFLSNDPLRSPRLNSEGAPLVYFPSPQGKRQGRAGRRFFQGNVRQGDSTPRGGGWSRPPGAG